MAISTEAQLENATPNVLTAFFQSLLESFGLGSLASFAASQAFQGVSDAEFIQNLELEEEYRTQFAPIFERRELGLPPITPADVLSNRRQIAQLEQFYELPTGTLDADAFLVGDVSYNEAQARVAFAAQLRDDEDPAVMAELRAMGVSDGGILAFGLNQDVALGALQEQVRVAQISVGARRGGFSLTVEEAAALEDQGLSVADVEQRAAALTLSGDVRAGVGGEFGALSREQEFGLLSGTPASVSELDRRARQLEARFRDGGGFLTDNSGAATGLGSA